MPPQPKKIGVLALQGDVREHVDATRDAAKKSKLAVTVSEVRTKEDLKDLNGLIIPGGESTTLETLLRRAGMIAPIKKVKNIFGTCAGAILISKTILNKVEGQTSLGLMSITVNRNAYGRQSDSFETNLRTDFDIVHAVFIRAPKITKVGGKVKVLAKHDEDIVACEEKSKKNYYLATAFHPELTTTVFHEHFLKNLV